MIRKLLVDYVQALNDLDHDHLTQIGKSVEVSGSIKTKRAVGMTDYTKKFLEKAEMFNGGVMEDD